MLLSERWPAAALARSVEISDKEVALAERLVAKDVVSVMLESNWSDPRMGVEEDDGINVGQSRSDPA